MISQNVRTGDIFWEWNCTDVTRDVYCYDSVEAEFALSPDGLMLYYGDIFGKIVALEVARSDKRTDQPTPLPTANPSLQTSNFPSSQPTVFSSLQPTIYPSLHVTTVSTTIPSQNPVIESSSNPSSSLSGQPSIMPSQPSGVSSYAPSGMSGEELLGRFSNLPSYDETSNNPSGAISSGHPSASLTSENPSGAGVFPTVIPSIRPSNLQSLNLKDNPPKEIETIQSSAPTPYYGILTLKSIPPEGQVAAVSFIGLSGVVAILGLAFRFKRRQKSFKEGFEDGGDLVTDDNSVATIGPSESGAYSNNAGMDESTSAGSDKAMILGIEKNVTFVNESEDERSLGTSLSSILEETANNKYESILPEAINDESADFGS